MLILLFLSAQMEWREFPVGFLAANIIRSPNGWTNFCFIKGSYLFLNMITHLEFLWLFLNKWSVAVISTFSMRYTEAHSTPSSSSCLLSGAGFYFHLFQRIRQTKGTTKGVIFTPWISRQKPRISQVQIHIWWNLALHGVSEGLCWLLPAESLPLLQKLDNLRTLKIFLKWEFMSSRGTEQNHRITGC